MTETLKTKRLIIGAALAVTLTAGPALACFPADPNRPALSSAESATARIERQDHLWNLSASVYLGRIVSAEWASETGPAPRDMGVEVVLDSIASVKGPAPTRQTLPMIACDPQDYARAEWRPGALVIVYANRIGLSQDWRRIGQWQILDFISVSENADPRIGPALRAAAARLRSDGS
ncbi:hypothetical protein [Brevundimonas sp.]|uniref:hypothetical protein n=1 Tax=Brevundimonas sp. TaxID=1871086 RepID=UPI001D3FCFAF|nr:hypothetical protein [Brevundimonas sp.]MBA3999544.1 hypothetical protein [Brevundimonas sp.]